jgi:hypothetical protein
MFRTIAYDSGPYDSDARSIFGIGPVLDAAGAPILG